MNTPSPSLPAPPTPEEIQEGFRQFSNDDDHDDVDLWHFAMMNDTARNSAYEAALSAALKKGGTVLDIGTGSGLLSMMAVRHGASKVVTCEAHPKIARKAREIILRNGYEGHIQIIEKKSTELVAGRDFPQQADVLVTEVFDDGLLGECALATIEHARKNLLKPDAQIIPAGAKVWAIAIESPEIFENGRVGQVSGFDLSAFNEFACNGQYIGYHLDKMKYVTLSHPKAVMEFDFTRSPKTQTVPFEVEAITSGVCHAVAYWYELKVDDSTTISTGPGLAKLSGWKQAVQILPTPLPVHSGERLHFLVDQRMESLSFLPNNSGN